MGQSNPDRSGLDQPPLQIPVAVALFDQSGNPVETAQSGNTPKRHEHMLELKETESTFIFEDVAHPPIVSLLRDLCWLTLASPTARRRAPRERLELLSRRLSAGRRQRSGAGGPLVGHVVVREVHELERAVGPNQHSDKGDRNNFGSWDPVGAWGEDGGRVYSTAILVLTLEAYYRYSRLVR